MKTIELTATETAAFEHPDARVRDQARREIRARAETLSQASGATVEIYSDDDVLLDAVEAQ